MNRNILYLIMNIIGVLSLLATTVIVLINWSQLPEQIPTHYNFAGEADGYGVKGALAGMMVTAWVIFIALTVLMKFPNTWNMPVKVTAENKARLYGITRGMLEIVKALTTLMFVVMLVSIAIATSLPHFIMTALIAAILLSVVIGIWLMYRNRIQLPKHTCNKFR